MHHQYGLPYVGLRYMNVYGERADDQGAYVAVIMKMLAAIEQGSSPMIHGLGSEAFDFVDVRDCAAANVAAMRSHTVDRFYNVGTGVKTSLSELAHLLLRVAGVERSVVHLPAREGNLVTNRIGDPARAAAELGFAASIGLEDGLRHLVVARRAAAH
jgi:UDP-glucose 4-epimerase